ncbi:DMT family transporter [Chitinimonas viridis]|uniref:DMT family transporter n=1 Tax=Chitinimonas viridis TaxID=664880 RepID=A0ABT8B619_9NEIS|nr:DMT family transporter [Chitinimonas viridis]MDN3577066.1 DMT family transporter [Chitinimonas viridis]
MSPTRFAFPALLAGAACIGFAGIFVRLSDIGPVATGFWRLLLATPVLWLLSLHTPAPPINRRRALALLAIGAFFALDLTVWHLSLHITTVANATLLTNCVPVFCVPLVGWLIWKEPIAAGFSLSFIVTLVGVLLLTGENFALAPTRFRGDLLATLAAVFYCGYLLVLKLVRQDMPVMRLMAISSAISAMVMLAIALFRGEAIWPSGWHAWSVLVALALITQVGGQSLIAYGLGHLPTHVSALGLMFQPLVATLAAWLLFAEAISPLQVSGAVVIVLGVWLAKRQTH